MSVGVRSVGRLDGHMSAVPQRRAAAPRLTTAACAAVISPTTGLEPKRLQARPGGRPPTAGCAQAECVGQPAAAAIWRLCLPVLAAASPRSRLRAAVFLTDVAGVYDRPPSQEGATLLESIQVQPDGSFVLPEVDVEWQNVYISATVFNLESAEHGITANKVMYQDVDVRDDPEGVTDAPPPIGAKAEEPATNTRGDRASASETRRRRGRRCT